MNKQHKRYELVIQSQLQQAYVRLTELTQQLPDELSQATLKPEYVTVINNIEAIEQEWITDPLQREELSMLQWEDTDDDGFDIDDHIK